MWCSPLDMQTWLSLLATDLYKLLHTRCGCEDFLDANQIMDEIDLSLSLSLSRHPGVGVRSSAISERVLAPLRDRVAGQLRFLDGQTPAMLAGS